LPQSGIPESSRSTIISFIIKHLTDSGDSEDKGSVDNNEVSGDAARTVADADKDVQSALSNIGQLSPNGLTVRDITKSDPKKQDKSFFL
jgi:hypothetical protein